MNALVGLEEVAGLIGAEPRIRQNSPSHDDLEAEASTDLSQRVIRLAKRLGIVVFSPLRRRFEVTLRYMTKYTDVELCAGAGGQAHGLELAGFEHVALVEIDRHACETLRLNRPQWNVLEADLHEWDPSAYEGVDLLSGGVPCPPFSVAGKQLGELDDRELFGRALEIIRQIKPRGVMLENVRGLLDPKFDTFRKNVSDRLRRYGYSPQWRLLQASDYGVSQLRPRVICVALRPIDMRHFVWPEPDEATPPTVGELLGDLMAANGWKGAAAWSKQANTIAPTLVGGSKLHGGADLGPTRAKRAWMKLGINGRSIADDNPPADAPNDFTPRLTVRMAARIQGFDDEWQFSGRKTSSYRQVGNAFPPAVARRVGQQIIRAWEATDGTGSAISTGKEDIPHPTD